MEFSWVPIIVAAIGAGGLGAVIREIAQVVSLAMRGVSGREDRRKLEIVEQRDHAYTERDRALLARDQAEAGERAADARADREATARRHWAEEAARLRIRLIDCGTDPGPWPDIEDTTPPHPRPH